MGRLLSGPRELVEINTRVDRLVSDARPLAPAGIRSLGFMISDGQAGPFELLIDWVAVQREDPDPDCVT